MPFHQSRLEKRYHIEQLNDFKMHADYVYQTFGSREFSEHVQANEWRYDGFTVTFEFQKKNMRNANNLVRITPFNEMHSWPFSAYSVSFGRKIAPDDSLQWDEGVSAIGPHLLALCFYQYTRIRKPANMDTTRLFK